MFTSLPTWPHLKALPAQLLQIKLGKPLDSRQESSGRQSDLAAFAAGVSQAQAQAKAQAQVLVDFLGRGRVWAIKTAVGKSHKKPVRRRDTTRQLAMKQITSRTNALATADCPWRN